MSGTTTVVLATEYEYDLNGNVRRSYGYYQDAVSLAFTSQDFWYKYDSQNRFTTTKGAFTGSRGSGSISAGASGVNITYDAASQRMTATSASSSEAYAYTEDGYLKTVHIGSVLRVVDLRDAYGRVTSHTEYQSDGSTVAFSRTDVQYDAVSNVIFDKLSTRQTNGQTSIASNTYSYSLASAYGGLGAGAYLGGSVTAIATNNAHLGSGGSYVDDPDASTTNSYVWLDDIRQGSISYKPNINNSTTYTTSFAYSGGQIQQVTIADGQPRKITYGSNVDGMIASRVEALDTTPGVGTKQEYYYFDGVKIGEKSNDGVVENDYATTISRRSYNQTGVFQYGSATSFADFDQSYDPINANNPGGSPGRYIVGEGDSLQSVATALWGDASLWYLIADANGLTASSQLAAGQALTIPARVANIHNNADTFRPYDPNKALGDVSPGLPKPPPKAGGCGAVGIILMVIIAVVVTYVTFGAMTSGAPTLLGQFGAWMGASATAFTPGTFAAAAISGAVGSIASQAVGVTAGIIDRFDWKAVALSAISAGVTRGLEGVFAVAESASALEKIASGFARGAVANVITQGVGVATGLQSRFDWTSVAVAGVISGVASIVPLPFAPSAAANTAEGMANNLVRGLAGSAAGAATRSLIDGSSFGDNLIADLPSVIGNTIGSMILAGVQVAGRGEAELDGSTIRLNDAGDSPVSERFSKDWEGRLSNLETLVGGLGRQDTSSGVQTAIPGLYVQEDGSVVGGQYAANLDRKIVTAGNCGLDPVQTGWDFGLRPKPVVSYIGQYREDPNSPDRVTVLLNVDGVEEKIPLTMVDQMSSEWDIGTDQTGAWSFKSSNPEVATPKVPWQNYIEYMLETDLSFAAAHGQKLLLNIFGKNSLNVTNLPHNTSYGDSIHAPFRRGNREYQVVSDGQADRIVETMASIASRAESARWTERRNVMAGGMFGGAAGFNLFMTGNVDRFDRFAGVAAAADNVVMSAAIGAARNRPAGRLGASGSVNNGLLSIGKNRVTFQGLEVRAVRDLSHIDSSTLSAMAKKGFPPKLINAESLVLHHYQQNPAGFIIEIPASKHSIVNTNQHPFGNTPGSGLTAQQRADFDVWRIDYWKARAQAELQRREPRQ